MAPKGLPALEQFTRFRVLLDAMSQPAILEDIEGRIALANQAAAKLWNRTPEELVGLTAGDLLDPASACWAEAVDTIMFHSDAPKLLRRIVKVPGQKQSFQVSVAPVSLTPAGRVDGIIVVAEPSNRDLANHGESAGMISDRQLAVLALLKCELREVEKKSQANRRLPGTILDASSEVVPRD